MATQDISRAAFDPRKHYSGVHVQQGRVILDDDFNEGERIASEEARQARLDTIGPQGSPGSGFAIANGRLSPLGDADFDILPGTLYLGGLRLSAGAGPAKPERFIEQDDWLQQPASERLTPVEGRVDLVYVEAWQQPVSAVEDAELFETALGGADTSTRLRTMHRVRMATGLKEAPCEAAWGALVSGWAASGLGTFEADTCERTVDAQLQVTFDTSGTTDDLCAPKVAGGYLGAENQAIRVELVDSRHFTWGFDNGGPLYRTTLRADRVTLTFSSTPKDEAHQPRVGQIVEILPWSAVLANGEKLCELRGHLARVATAYDPGTRTLVLDAGTAVPAGFGGDWQKRPHAADLGAPSYFVRVWDRGGDVVSSPAIAFTPGVPVALAGTGLLITLTGQHLVAADHWIIAARPETPNRVVPWALEVRRGPHGVRRFFAPLALIRWHRSGSSASFELLHDCRQRFDPLTRLQSCCTYHLSPESGWEQRLTGIPDGADAQICFENGDYVLSKPLLLQNKGSLRLTGYGPGTRIIALNDETAILFKGCRSVHVQDLYAEGRIAAAGGKNSHLGGALTFSGCQQVTVERVALRCAAAQERSACCLAVSGLAGSLSGPADPSSVRVRDCDMQVGNQQVGMLLVNLNSLHVEGNSLRLAESAAAADFAAMMRDPLCRAAMRKLLIANAKLTKGDSKVANVTSGTFSISFQSDKALLTAWQPLFNANAPAAISSAAGLLRWVKRLANRVLLRDPGLKNKTAFDDFYNSVSAADLHPPAAAIGIVVAGSRAGEARVLHNTIQHFRIGIQVGLSHHEVRRGAPDQVERAVLSGNRLHLRLPTLLTGQRFGIFVGNCNSLIIDGNYLSLERSARSARVYVEAVRVFGHLGPMMIVRHNHIVGFTVGTNFNPVERPSNLPMWLATDNLALSADHAIVVGKNAVNKVRADVNLS